MDCSKKTTNYPSDCEILEGLRTRSCNKEKIMNYDAPLLAKAAAIQLVLLDVDGVLTDGSLIYDSNGQESKSFNTQDGFGIRLLQEAGVDVGVITARQSAAVSNRCQNLNLRYVYQGECDKRIAYEDILKKSKCKPVEICYMGDDWLDMILLKRAGLAAAPANAVAEVKKLVHFVTPSMGGNGAVRDLATLILTGKGLLKPMLQKYMNR